MPLSEDEQRILQEIERSFYDSDPAFAREVSASLTGPATKAIRLSIAGFAVGLLVLILGFTRSVFFGLAGFALMVWCGFTLYMNLAKLSKASMKNVKDRAAQAQFLGRRPGGSGPGRRPGPRR